MVTVDSKGRIVLPRDVREQLGLRPGSEVDVTVDDERVVVEPETAPDQIMHELDTLIDEAAANRKRRRTDGREARPGLTLEDDPIAANHRAIIRRGATRADSDETDEYE